MNPTRKSQNFPRRERYELCALFCLQGHAMALWYVPFSSVLTAHGLGWLTPYAFACSAVAALISPMLIGVLADQHYSAERILRWLAVTIAAMLTLTFLAIERRWGAGMVMLLLQIQQLCHAPALGLTSAIVLSRLRQPEREFGRVRAWLTLGFMLAGVVLSFGLKADRSTLSGFVSAVAWLGVAAFTLRLPPSPPTPIPGPRRWRDRLGLDALGLLRDRNHRAVFVMAGLFSIPLAAYYPFTVIHLQEAGEVHVSAAMSLGQVTEIFSMYALAWLLARLRLKTIFLIGLFFGVLRYGLYTLDTRAWLLAGIALHGISFTLIFVAAQIYVEKRIHPRFRVRAQALLGSLTTGVGTLLGSLGSGWWRQWCTNPADRTDWTLYWAVLSSAVAAVFLFFAISYRATGRIHEPPAPLGTLPPVAPLAVPGSD